MNGVVSKDVKNLFLTLHEQNLHCQQRELPMFLMCYQQFASHAYCDAILETGPVVSMRSEMLVAHEKQGQFSLLTVFIVVPA
jgi:hypothetical protein